MDRDMLSTYLNDHLGGATLGRDLAKRLVDQNQGTRFEPELQRIYREIAEDRESLLDLMGRLGIDQSKLKVAGGWAAEKVGRLKLNNRLTGYSPLSRLLELEALSGGAHAKLSLWQVLHACADDYSALHGVGLETLERRARDQLDSLERLRVDAGHEALVGEPAPAT